MPLNKENLTGNSSQPRTRTRASGTVPEINWGANNSKLVWDLLNEIEQGDNHKVLFGKKDKTDNTPGVTKVSVYKTIALKLFPDHCVTDVKTVASRVKSKVEGLINTYKVHQKRLRKTGEGVRDDDALDTQDPEAQSQGGDQYMEFYIPAEGPTDETPERAKNLWAQICREFQFFPRLHLLLSSRPNVTPIAVTTGTGPRGHTTLFIQAPSPEPQSYADQSHEIDNDSGPAATFEQNPTTFNSMTPATSRVQGQPATLLDIMNLANNDPDFFSRLNVPATPANNVPVIHGVDSPVAGVRAPKSSQFSQSTPVTTANVKETVKKRTPKRTIEETILDVSQKNMSAMHARADRLLVIDQRRILLDELKMGVWTPEQYRRKIKILEGHANDYSESGPSAKKPRGHSPDWDTSLLDNDEDEDEEFEDVFL